MTLDSIVYNILNLSNGGRTVHNTYIDRRQIIKWIEQHRATIIRRDMARNRRTIEIEQYLNDLSLEASQIAVASDDVTFYKTEVPIPQLLRFKDREAITNVTLDDQTVSFQVTDHVMIPWLDSSQYTKNDKYVFVMPDRTVHIRVPAAMDTPSVLSLRGVFESPVAVNEFNIDRGITTEDAEWDYPISEDLAEAVVKAVMETEMGWAKASPLDTKHNNLPDDQILRSAQ